MSLPGFALAAAAADYTCARHDSIPRIQLLSRKRFALVQETRVDRSQPRVAAGFFIVSISDLKGPGRSDPREDGASLRL
jgi:hypothetical protein